MTKSHHAATVRKWAARAHLSASSDLPLLCIDFIDFAAKQARMVYF